MTPQEIRDAIAANPQIEALLPDAQAVADALSAGRTKLVETLGGVGVVMETLGPEAGAAVLDTLDALRASMSPVKWAWVLIERGELDFGSAATRGMIQQLAAAGVFTQESATALLALAEVPDPVTAFDVEGAIYGGGSAVLDEAIQITAADGTVIAAINVSLAYGGATLTFNPQWHTPTQLDQYAARLNQVAQKMRDAGIK